MKAFINQSQLAGTLNYTTIKIRNREREREREREELWGLEFNKALT